MSLKKNNKPGGLSALIEMSPKEIDDRTSTIDPISLKKAKKEAAKALMISKRDSKKYSRKSKSSRYLGPLLSVGFLVVLVVSAGQMNWISFPELTTKLLSTVDRIFSPLPTLEDVSAEDYNSLKNAALSDKSFSIAIALSDASLQHPSFYVASSLPEGMVLSFYLHPILESLLVDNLENIRVQVTLNKKLAKSIVIRTNDGKDLPIGEYQAVVTEEDEQPFIDKNFLNSLPVFTGKLPEFIPAGKKFVVVRNFFLGGQSDAEYLSALKVKSQQRDEIRKIRAVKSLSELNDLQAWLDEQFKATMVIQGVVHKMLSSLVLKAGPKQLEIMRRKLGLNFSRTRFLPRLKPYDQTSGVIKLWTDAANSQSKFEEMDREIQKLLNSNSGTPNLVSFSAEVQIVDNFFKNLGEFQTKLKTEFKSLSGVN